MIMSDMNLKPYLYTSYHNEELKSLTRYRFDKVKERAKLKCSVSRLVCILFSEFEKLVHTLHMASVYALLFEFPSADAVATAHLTRLSNLLSVSSKGRYGKDTAIRFREAARSSISSHMPAKSLELKHTIKRIMDEEIHSPIITIPGISYRMGANSADKILAYAGMSPSTYQSGQLDNCYSHTEKRGSRYLRYALYNAAKYVCHWDESFGTYLAKKRAEGKHYNVALSNATKKLVRTIYAMEKSGQTYIPTAQLILYISPFRAPKKRLLMSCNFQGSKNRFLILLYLKYFSVIHSKNFILGLDF